MIKKMNLYFLTAFILITSSVLLYSANEKFTTSVNKNKVGVGEQIQLTYSLENAQGNNFKPPTFKGFSVLAGPSSSNYTQIINGKVSSSMSYTYILRAENEGTYSIPGAAITVNGSRLSSNSVNITVTKASPNQQSRNNSQSNLQNQGNQSNKQDNSKTLDAQANDVIAKNMFIKLNVNKSTCYKGEPIYAVYKLYINPELTLLNLTSPKMPVFNGFWSQEIEIKAIEFTGTEIVNGIRYKTAELKKVVLIPQQSGDLTVDGLNLDSKVRLRVQGQQSRSNDPFDDFFGGGFGSSFRDFNYEVKSQTAKVKVKALPENAPAQFNGAVGNYKFDVSLDKDKVMQNEPVSLKVKISGSGNLKLVQAPELNLPPDIEKFDPKINDNISISAAGLSGEKTFEYILIAKNPGQFKIPALTFVYFDYSKGQYISISSKELLLNVEKGNYQDYASSSVNKQDVQYLGKDIRFIKDDSNLNPVGYSFIKSSMFYILTALPIMCFIIFILYKRRKDEINENQDIYKSKYANKTAIKALSAAKKKYNEGDITAVYEEVHKSILNYFAHKFTMDNADLSKDNISIVLNSKNYSMETIETVNDILQTCEMARYAPVAEAEDANHLINQAEMAITSMEGK